MMVPISGVIPLNDKLYEHWLYVPMVGFWLVVFGLLRWLGKDKWKRLSLLGVMVVLVWVGLTMRQERIWKDGLSLYTYNLQFGDDVRLLNNLGYEYVKREEYEKAKELFEKAVEVSNQSVWTVLNLAQVYELQGKQEQAEYYYDLAENKLGDQK